MEAQVVPGGTRDRTGHYKPVRKCSQVLGGSRKVQVAPETG